MSTNDEIQNILVKNSEKFVQEFICTGIKR